MEIIRFENFLNESNYFTYTKGCIMLDFNYNKWEDFIKHLIDEKDIYDKEGFGFEEEPHVTILFGILPNKHTFEEVKEKLLETDINLHRYYELKYISIFESKEYDVLKFDLKDCDEIFELNKYCVKEFEFENDYPKYHPHVTIAYIKKGRGKKYIQNLIEPLIVQPFELVYSYPNEDGSENLKDTILEYEPLDENIEFNIYDNNETDKHQIPSINPNFSEMRSHFDEESNLIEDVEINENIISDDDWAIFKITYSEKHFVTKLNGKEDEKYIGEYDSSLRYSDPEVLKFSLEDAKRIVNNSLHFGEKIGIVNSKGIQELFTEKLKKKK